MAGNVSSEALLCSFAHVTRVNTLIMCEKQPPGPRQRIRQQAAHSLLEFFQGFGKIIGRGFC